VSASSNTAAAPPTVAPGIATSPAAAVGWRRLLAPSWPLIVALLFFARLLAAKTALLNDPDTYLHIAAGNWIVAHGALPTHDPFSHSMPGTLWLAGEWLAEIVLALVFDEAGWAGVVLLSAACAAAAIGILAHFLLRRLPALPALIAAALAIALVEPHVLARPHILALPILALWPALLLAARDDDRAPPFAALPLMALWANLHGSFLFGLAFAAYLGGEAVLQPGSRSRRSQALLWGGFVLAATLAALCNPHGIATLIQPFRLMRMPALQASFAEWLSPDFQKAPEVELWLLAAVFVGFSTGVRLPWPRLVLLLGLIHMTLQHSRHADVLALVGPLVVAAPLAPALAALNAPSGLGAWFARLAQPAKTPAIVLMLVVGALLALPTALTPITRDGGAATPSAALAAAQRLGLTGPVFNSEMFGGYLISRGVPVFIDGRIEMYGNDFLADDVAAERGDAAVLQRLLTRYRVAWTLLQPGSGAAQILEHLPGWRRVYADKWAVVDRRIALPPQ